MLDETGRFEFRSDLLELVERLWSAYVAWKGEPPTPVERLAGRAYVLAVLKKDVEALWSELTAAPELQGVPLEALLQNALASPGLNES